VTNYRDLDFNVLQALAENTNNIRKIRMHVHADFSLREVQGLLSEIGGVREIHSAGSCGCLFEGDASWRSFDIAAHRLYPKLGSNAHVGKRSGAICRVESTFKKNFVVDRTSKGAARLARNGSRRGTAGRDYG
jgi:hypothetical protein